MRRQVLIKSGEYYDSITLLQVSTALAKTDGVRNAAVVMATAANKELLADAGLLTDEAQKADASDLLIAIAADDDTALRSAFGLAESLLKDSRAGRDTIGLERERPRSVAASIAQMPDANLAMISVGGPYAAAVAYDALARGLHVFIFSDNVSLEDEIKLKTFAAKRGLFVMGPDAGTAVINGASLGFANSVARGEVGIVAASGTGLQSVMSALSQMGAGVSQAIGVGGRDVSDAVGGVMMLQAITALQEDAATKVIAVVSKPPCDEVREKIVKQLARHSKPTVVCFLGSDEPSRPASSPLHASDLEETAYLVAALLKSEPPYLAIDALAERDSRLKLKSAELRQKLNPSQKYFRGLFCGGSFCYETQMLLQRAAGVGAVYSNAPLDKQFGLHDIKLSQKHTALDLGDDRFTAGRLHPMIDSTIRNLRILQEARGADVGVIYLDFVLGFGVDDNPVGSAQQAIIEAQRIAATAGREVIFLASVCGTDTDPQGLQRQEESLKQLGVTVLPSNAAAAKVAGWILCQR